MCKDTTVYLFIYLFIYFILGDDIHHNKPASASKSAKNTQSMKNEYETQRPRSNTKEQNVRLYNIKKDPCEYEDLSARHPGIVQILLKRLAFYNSSAVPVIDFHYDLNHTASDTGGAWVPWVTGEL